MWCCTADTIQDQIKIGHREQVSEREREDFLPNQACWSPWTSIARPKSANFTAAPFILLASNRFSGWGTDIHTRTRTHTQMHTEKRHNYMFQKVNTLDFPVRIPLGVSRLLLSQRVLDGEGLQRGDEKEFWPSVWLSSWIGPTINSQGGSIAETAAGGVRSPTDCMDPSVHQSYSLGVKQQIPVAICSVSICQCTYCISRARPV